MYLAIEPQPTSTQAWLAAATAVKGNDGEAINVVIDILDPLLETDTDAAIIREVDKFLRGHDANSLSGVANTIFPQATFDRHGPEAFYAVYREQVLPRMKKMTKDWGRYFDRLTQWKKVSKGQVSMVNPLRDLISFMRNQVASGRTYRNVYEMTVFDPTRDAGKVSNRQCLSFLSFKLDPSDRLHLTVMYRNHAYIARGLGNFIGLGWLQRFVAEQSGATMGNLTCISTHAEIDFGGGWTKTEADGLLTRCRLLNQTPSSSNA
jgi:thymidylate synthase